MSIRQLLDYGIEIQGAYRIKKWNDKQGQYIELANGSYFENEYYKLEERYLDENIRYIYSDNNELNIEI